MSYDSVAKKIVIPSGDTSGRTFLMDSGVFSVHVLRDLAEDPKCSEAVKRDWNTIEAWLGSAGRALNDGDNRKIKEGWAAYLAIGAAPSPSLEDTFKMISRSAGAQELRTKKPPREVLNVFDRMLATDEEIRGQTEKRIRNAKALHDAVNSRPSALIWPDLTRLSRLRRAYLVGCSAWAVLVVVRTAFDFEFLGYYLEQWDDDGLLLNLLIPPAAVFLSYKAYKWVGYGS